MYNYIVIYLKISLNTANGCLLVKNEFDGIKSVLRTSPHSFVCRNDKTNLGLVKDQHIRFTNLVADITANMLHGIHYLPDFQFLLTLVTQWIASQASQQVRHVSRAAAGTKNNDTIT